PKAAGEFDLQAFVWENIENPNALVSPTHLKINVQNKGHAILPEKEYNKAQIISNLDTIIEIYAGFPPTKDQLNDAIKLYDICWKWAKEKFSSKYEINLLKTKPVSFIRLLAAPNPSKELKATKDELIMKASR